MDDNRSGRMTDDEVTLLEDMRIVLGNGRILSRSATLRKLMVRGALAYKTELAASANAPLNVDQ